MNSLNELDILEIITNHNRTIRNAYNSQSDNDILSNFIAQNDNLVKQVFMQMYKQRLEKEVQQKIVSDTNTAAKELKSEMFKAIEKDVSGQLLKAMQIK